MEPKFIIYGLFDPRDGQLRYVGKSSRGMLRPKIHSQPSHLKADPSHKANWIRQLLVLHLRPEIDILEITEVASDLNESEQFNIAYFRGLGCDLTNQTPGGDGMPVGHKHSFDTRKRMSISQHERLRGPRPDVVERNRSEAQRLALRGHVVSEASRAKMALGHHVRDIIDETGRVFSSQNEASRVFGVSDSSIWKVLHGRMPSTCGHSLRYVE